MAALIRHHQVPFWALERPRDLDRIVLRVSLLASNDDLALLATADILGRVCADAAGMLDNIALFRSTAPDALPGHAPARSPPTTPGSAISAPRSGIADYAAYDDTRSP